MFPTSNSLPAPSNASASSSRLVPPYSRTLDDLELGPAPLTVPSMANLFPDSPFSFRPIYSDTPDELQNHEPRAMSMGEPSDFSSRYRERADMLRRTSEHAALGSFSGDVLGFSAEMRGSGVWNSSTASQSGTEWPHPRFSQDPRHLRPPHPFQLNETATNYRRYSMSAGPSRQRPQMHLDLDFGISSRASIPSSASSEVGIRSMRNSDASYGVPNSSHPSSSQFDPSHSFPSSASFSHPALSSHISATLPPIIPASAPSTTEAFDESAFGALSLEDPALLIHDAPPFFSSLRGTDDPGLTPTPVRPNTAGSMSTPTPANVADGDGDLWRAFMRNTPLEQPGTGQAQARGVGIARREADTAACLLTVPLGIARAGEVLPIGGGIPPSAARGTAPRRPHSLPSRSPRSRAGGTARSPRATAQKKHARYIAAAFGWRTSASGIEARERGKHGECVDERVDVELELQFVGGGFWRVGYEGDSDGLEAWDEEGVVGHPAAGDGGAGE
ncbi:hypothetical protein C0991_000261 [Blastosporella zonata]|nr:hypothetical protein C0991_000261 [Blastosporella zonata]